MSIKTIDPITNSRNIGYINSVIRNLGINLGLIEIELPTYIEKGSPLNDGLNGEQPVSFTCTGNGKEYEIVHSHAKMKRHYLSEYVKHFSNLFLFDYKKPNGIVTRMNAIRAFEEQDITHHFSVRQLDIEMIAPINDGSIDIDRIIEDFVRGIIKSLEIPSVDEFKIVRSSGAPVADHLDDITSKRDAFEQECGEKYGAFVVLGIGKSNPCNVTADNHDYAYDHRSPDYDDHRFNGDILIYHPLLKRTIEICSFGYRVDKQSLARQMKAEGKELTSTYHDDIANDRLVQTIGGGIGIDRLLMVRFCEKSVHDTNPN